MNGRLNDLDYWDNRFLTDWDEFDGPQQSKFFADLAVELFPDWLSAELAAERLRFCDWGCAEGDGTERLAAAWPNAVLTGIDFSPSAIATASSRYPQIQFAAKDYTTSAAPDVALYDIVFSSNTLEHFAAPWTIAERLTAYATRYLVCLVPFEEWDRHSEHEHTFSTSEIPQRLGTFSLVFHDWIDVSEREPCYWKGKQALIIFKNENIIARGIRSMPNVNSPLVRLKRLITGAAKSIRARGPAKSLALLRQSMASEGLSPTIAKVRRAIASDRRKMVPAGTPDTWDQEAAFLRAYADVPLGWKQQRIAEALGDWKKYKGVVLAPVAYPISLKQRPEHILRALADEGYLCVLLERNNESFSVREISPGLLVSNLFVDFIAFFRNVPVVLYLHFAPYCYIADALRHRFIVYDVLDDLSVMTGGARTAADHRKLVATADRVLFSSPQLWALNKAEGGNRAIQLQNGVWPRDFEVPTRSISEQTVRVGYHGVISELLDFDLLDTIAGTPKVSLTLVGPIANFDPRHDVPLRARVSKLLSNSSVTHLGVLPYGELRRYLAEVDVGLIPFVRSAQTEGVSPLKLFEYLAAGLPVVATPTATLELYSSAITLASPAEIPGIIASHGWKSPSIEEVQKTLDDHSWSNLVAPLLMSLPSPVASPAEPRATSGRIDIINVNFFDWNGESLYKGGAERYVLDLAKLCLSKGLKPRILQRGNVAFEREVQGVPVLGVPVPQHSPYHDGTSQVMMRVVHDADLVIASPLEMASRLDFRTPCIGINHGIHWDWPFNRHYSSHPIPSGLIYDAVERCRSVVCVDTNFINWLRIQDWDLASGMIYVPNYVDHAVFKKTEKSFDGRLRFLFPRRLYKARGLYITIEAFDELFSVRDDFTLTFCGQGEADDVRQVEAFLRRHPDRISLLERDMDEMAPVYAESDVALVPTINSEGTSLSCIEAFASNTAVIATNVGGLPNLVFDEVTGLLIGPTASELKNAAERLLDDRALCRTLATRAVEYAAHLGKDRWERQWSKVIDNALWVRS